MTSVSIGGGWKENVLQDNPVCSKWWTNFSAMCLSQWQTRWFTEGDLKRLMEYHVAMGRAHLQSLWGKLLWSHLWIDHMYFFAHKG